MPTRSDYRLFFLCAFSNILKPTSRWLTKSIKPQIDPDKKPTSVLKSFEEQFQFMISANEQSDATYLSSTKIVTSNFLNKATQHPKVDMIITSPPYVTSYEYADLHQLSSLWLGYADDYRDLREGSIGSLQHSYDFNKKIKNLNQTGTKIVLKMLRKDRSKARAITKYFLDMQQVAKSCSKMLTRKGMSVFVIGNTKYKGVKIDNALHLAESLEQNGFSEILVTKRKISKKNLTPYRDSVGRFTSDKRSRKIYSEEFILIGRK